MPADRLRRLPDIRRLTPARVALGRSGASLPTAALLSFALDHARARDAVHARFDPAALCGGLAAAGLPPAVTVASQAHDRASYLRRPDLGRRLADDSARLVGTMPRAPEPGLTVMIGDGLSPTAVHAHATELLRSLATRLASAGILLAHVVVAGGARVALGDEIGELLGSRMVLVLIGERPGLSTPDSLGAYLTLSPRVGLTDADRNCVSNIHRQGLSYEEAAFRIAWLVTEGLRRGVTGVALKDESGDHWRRIAQAGSAGPDPD